MDELELANFIEDEIKHAKDNIPKHIIFLNDPYGLTQNLIEETIKIFGKEYQVVRYLSDFFLRGEIEKYKDDDSKNICIVSQRKKNKLIEDYTGWRSNTVFLTPQRILEKETGESWCETINIIGNQLLNYKEQIKKLRKRIKKSTLLPNDAKAIIISALTNIDFIGELKPTDAYFFLYPKNNYKELTESMPELREYIKTRLRPLIPASDTITESEEHYQDFPHYLWLFYIIKKLGKDPSEHMRGITSELYDKFEKLKIPSGSLLELTEALQTTNLKACKKQVSRMEEEILRREPAAERQFKKLIPSHPHDPLTYYIENAERDKYTKISLENIFNHLPDYIIENPAIVMDERFSQIIDGLQMHWFINEYQDAFQLLNDLKLYYEHQHKLNEISPEEIATSEKWLSIFSEDIVPLEVALSRIEISPKLHSLSAKNRDRLRQDYEDIIWRYNKHFQNFIMQNYPKWTKTKERPILTADFLDKIFKPQDPLRKYKHVYIIVFDCMRVDIWNELKQKFMEKFEIIDEHLIYSMVPSSTIFSRTCIFSGKLPKHSVVAPSGRRPYRMQGDEGTILELALGILPGNIEITSQAESAVRIDDVDRVLDSPKKLKVLILNSIDNRIHKAGAEDRLGKIKQDFLNVYDTVIKSILNKLGEEMDSILFVLSDHGFIKTDKILLVETEKGYISERYVTLNPMAKLDTERATVLTDEACGIEGGGQRYGFPLGNISFKPLKEGKPVRTRVRDEIIFGHGGLTLQEMIVPCAVLIPRRERRAKAITIRIKSAECIEEKESLIIFEVKNPNYLPIQHVNVHSNIAAPIYIPSIDAHSSKEFKVSFTPKKEGEMDIKLVVNYKLQDVFHESKHRKSILVKRNPEIVRRYIDTEFDRLVG